VKEGVKCHRSRVGKAGWVVESNQSPGVGHQGIRKSEVDKLKVEIRGRPRGHKRRNGWGEQTAGLGDSSPNITVNLPMAGGLTATFNTIHTESPHTPFVDASLF
jgi:hypothetical protein